jgi:flagellar biosynthesis/type III secretory pathway chaperone
MKAVVKELFEIIEAEIANQDETRIKLEEQQNLLVECTLDKLEDHLKKLDPLKRIAVELDQARISLKIKLAHDQGLQEEGITLAMIADSLDPSSRETLLSLRDRLMESVKGVRAQSRRNMVLIRQSMELNHELLAHARGEEQERSTTYDQTGDLESTSGKGMVDARV